MQYAEAVVNQFNKTWYENYPQTWYAMTWHGCSLKKNPCDLWIYQEIIHRHRPELIIETGTDNGGSAYFLACMLDINGGAGRVITVDTRAMAKRPTHNRITYINNDSANPEIAESISKIAPAPRTMVILDSNHRKAHVLKELALYAPLVTPGQYLIVEDTNLNGHPVTPGWGEGPYEAVQEFMTGYGRGRFEIDAGCEKYMLTFNPNGYLKRIK